MGEKEPSTNRVTKPSVGKPNCDWNEGKKRDLRVSSAARVSGSREPKGLRC